MAAKKKSGARKYSKAASAKVETAMHERKRGALTSGRSGRTVKSKKQAIAIGLSEARAEGKKVPKKRVSAKNEATGAREKRTSARGATDAREKRASARGATDAKTKRASNVTGAKKKGVSAKTTTTGGREKRASASKTRGAKKKRASARGATSTKK